MYLQQVTSTLKSWNLKGITFPLNPAALWGDSKEPEPLDVLPPCSTEYIKRYSDSQRYSWSELTLKRDKVL